MLLLTFVMFLQLGNFSLCVLENSVNLFIYLFWFLETGFLCSFGACLGTSSFRSDWPRTHRDPQSFASQVLRLKAYAATLRLESSTFYEDTTQ